MNNKFLSLHQVKLTGLPYFDLSENEAIPLVFMTFSELKNLGYKLNDEQRKKHIQAYVKMSKRMNGYTPVYDMREIIKMIDGECSIKYRDADFIEYSDDIDDI